MAYLTFGSLEINPGVTHSDGALNINELKAVISAAGDTYFANSDNWKTVMCVYKSSAQQKVVSFTNMAAVTAGKFVASPFIMQEDFVLKLIKINDFDGGSYTYKLTEAEQALPAYTMEVIPSGPNPIFESTWNITSANNIVFEVESTDTFKIDWGQGDGYITIPTGSSNVVSPQYAIGEYTIKIDATDPAHVYEHLKINVTRKQYLTEVTDLGACGWTNFANAFDDCANLTAVSGGDLSTVTNVSGMFDSCTSLTSIDTSTWQSGTLTAVANMFQGASAITSVDLSGLDTSAITNMYHMFYGASSLTSINTKDWDVSSVTATSDMFPAGNSITLCCDAGNVTWFEARSPAPATVTSSC